MKIKGNVIGEISRSKRIYRVFPKKRFFQLFSDRMNAMVRPTRWHDPFENFILRSQARTLKGEIRDFPFHNDLYGQCWTLQTRSDAMWRIYSPCGNAVRVRTTVGRLIDSLSAVDGNFESDRCYIGRVEYLANNVELNKFARTVFKNGVNASAIACSLLVKRKAFDHEKEVRLIYIKDDKIEHKKGVYRYSLDPHDVFDQVLIDPRMSDEDYCQLKREIVSRVKFDEEKIRHSALYRPPKNFIINIP